MPASSHLRQAKPSNRHVTPGGVLINSTGKTASRTMLALGDGLRHNL